MKKTFKFFALAAIILAASCTKENYTETPSTDGNDFTATFEGVKTTLDNYTPKWVAGDAIGITTDDDANVQCDIKDVDKGTFKADDIQGSAPYYAVYPYSADNTFDGDVLTAVVPSTQQLVSGSPVAPGAMVAACKSESKTLAFKNCVGLLKITIPTTDVKKVVVASTTQGEKIAGKFTVDFSAETLTPAAASEDVDSTVTLLPPAGDDAFTAGSYYVAVIPNAIKSFKITFTNTSDKEVAVSKSTALALERNKCIDLGSFFTYKLTTAAEMIKWAKQSAKFTTWDYVTVENDITFTEAEAAQYVEANKFCGIFDGQNHKITGLTTAIFGDLQGIVKNLEVESNIVTDLKNATKQCTGSLTYGTGIVAHYFKKETNTGAYVDNVITRGSVKISGASVANAHQIGGLAGASNGVPVTNCKNYAAVEVDGITYTKAGLLGVGGCLGTAQSKVVNYQNLENYGTVTVKNVTQYSGTPFVAGVIGYHTQANTLDACKNYGTVSTSGSISITTTKTYVAIGGISANTTAKTIFNNCENYGKVTADGTTFGGKISYLAVGGVLGNTTAAAQLNNCENYSAVTTAGSTFGGAVDYFAVAGVLGNSTAGATLANCKNNADADVTLAGDLGGTFGYIIAGGVFGNNATNATMTLTDCSNEATVTNEANLTATSGDNYCYTGGVAGNFDKNVVMTDCSNSGAVYDKIADATNPKTHYLAGCVGRTYADVKLTRCTNSGKVEYASSAAVGIAAAGIIGYINKSATITDCTNTGNVSETTSFSTKVDVRVGGIAANVTGSKPSTTLVPTVTFSGCRNEGTLTIQRTAISGTVYSGGIIASASQYFKITDCTNIGAITSSTPCANIYVGGIYGSMTYGFCIESCENSGNVTNTGTVTGNFRVGGIVGNGCCLDPITADGETGWTQSTYSKISDCDNSAEIKNASASTAVVRLGGILGSSTNGAVEVLSCDNRGNVTNNTSATVKNAQLGGIAGYMGNANGKIDACTTKSTVSSTGTVTTCYAAAVLGQCGTSVTFTLSNTKLAGEISGSTVTTTNGTVTSDNYASHIYANKGGTAPVDIDTCGYLSE